MLSTHLFVAVLSLLSPSDEPQVRADVPTFGQRGQLVLRGQTNANVLGYHYRNEVGDKILVGNRLSFSVEPSAGVFVVDNLLVGGLINVNYAYQSGNYNVGAAVGPYLGYRVRMGQAASFLPTVAGIYDFSRFHAAARNSTVGAADSDSDEHAISVRLALDFVFHVAPRVSLTAGPFATQTVYAHASDATPMETTYGIRAGVLAWL